MSTEWENNCVRSSVSATSKLRLGNQLTRSLVMAEPLRLTLIQSFRFALNHSIINISFH